MLYGLYLSTAGAKAQSWRQDIIANNIANATTDGFRRQFFAARERLSALGEMGAPAPVAADDLRNLGGGPAQYDAPSDLQTTGYYQTTSRPLDLAIKGRGFFHVRRDGERLLTRDGAFDLDKNGILTTADHRAQVLDVKGQRIQLDPDLPVRIGASGEVFQGESTVAQLNLGAPVDPESIERLGSNLYRFEGGYRLQDASVSQFMLEGSNVNAINEMTDMIAASRAFEMNINMIQLQNEGLSTLLQTVPRLS